MKKGTASEEELKKLYDPNTFYEHGDNPAFKQFMNIAVENLREGKLTDHRTYVVDTYKKWMYARNWDDFLQRDCKAFTFPRAFALWICGTLGMATASKWCRQILPVGSHGITKISQTQFFHQFGPLGTLGAVGVYGLTAYLYYKTTLFTVKKFYSNCILQEREWIYEQERQNPGYGEYFFKDVPLSAEEHFSDLARGEMAKKKIEKANHEF
ncbi:hypothetical protein ABPG72_004277 [Tetrahymena utriculariae]